MIVGITMAGLYYTGCAVWAFNGWSGSFYPEGSRPGDFLKLYCDRMTAVEGNTTFYAQPSQATIRRWAATMPNYFRFCPKLPQIYSHQGALTPLISEALRFLQSLNPLGDRLGPVMLQLPPSYSPQQLPDLCAFLTAWPRQGHPIGVEVRHPDWFHPPHSDVLNQMLTDLGVGRVLLDSRPIYDGMTDPLIDPQIASERKKPRVPLQPVVTADFAMVRYISHPDLATNDPYFCQWVRLIQQWLQAQKTVYWFAHCPQEAKSPAVAREVYHRLQSAGVKMPPLGWDRHPLSVPPDPPQQLSLF